MQSAADETAARSPLEKPLHQLTEDDISQLTREDCRRFLKEKGMRRPSWNKSQAIQQVISLKTLLEAPPESDDGQPPPRRRYIPRPDNAHRAPANPSVSVRVTAADSPISVPAEESAPYRRHDPPLNDITGNNPLPPPSAPAVRHAAADNDSVSPRSTGAAATEQAGQMTIFYCGKVNVYDGMPRDKARVILRLAASPLPLTQDSSPDGSQPVWAFPGQSETQGPKAASISSALGFPSMQTVKLVENCQLQRDNYQLTPEVNQEGPASRKASVQRYLEKRKDRFKHKRKVGMPCVTAANLDIYYLNNRMGDQVSNEHWSSGDACSSPQSMRCISVENPAKHSNLAADLGAKDVQEC
ncbi:unnamed protein product [Linum trigynum]|uniref:Protein TIFY n=1 Tax=Linum trigynum TaxID=586398 RepID=A0AAV2EAS0_9ROSI